MKKTFDPFVVDYAKFNRLKLRDENGKFHQNINISEAKKMAQAAGLDLVCFSEPSGGDLAFCKILNYGKWKYDQEKIRKKNATHKTSTKEIRLSPVISDHDVEHKINKAKEFLENKDEVVFFMRLKGRQRVYFKEAEERMNEIVKLCTNGKEVSRKRSGNNISVRVTYKGGKDE